MPASWCCLHVHIKRSRCCVGGCIFTRLLHLRTILCDPTNQRNTPQYPCVCSSCKLTIASSTPHIQNQNGPCWSLWLRLTFKPPPQNVSTGCTGDKVICFKIALFTVTVSRRAGVCVYAFCTESERLAIPSVPMYVRVARFTAPPAFAGYVRKGCSGFAFY